jgi:hypothetical protein
LYTFVPVFVSLSDVAYWFAPLLVHAFQSTTAALDPMVFWTAGLAYTHSEFPSHEDELDVETKLKSEVHQHSHPPSEGICAMAAYPLERDPQIERQFAGGKPIATAVSSEGREEVHAERV